MTSIAPKELLSRITYAYSKGLPLSVYINKTDAVLTFNISQFSTLQSAVQYVNDELNMYINNTVGIKLPTNKRYTTCNVSNFNISKKKLQLDDFSNYLLSNNLRGGVITV